MPLLEQLKKLLLYKPQDNELFILEEGSVSAEMDSEESGPEPGAKQVAPKVGPTPPADNQETEEKKEQQPPGAKQKQFRKPIPVSEKVAQANEDDISFHLETNKVLLERLFHTEQNKDIAVRDFLLPTNGAGMIVYIDGIVDVTRVNFAILQPLMVLARRCAEEAGEKPERVTLDAVMDHLMPAHQAEVLQSMDEVVKAVLNGITVLFLEGESRAIGVETRSFPTRSVSTPQVEAVVRGPQEAFTESQRINISLVRKFVRDRNLVSEPLDVGENATAMLLYVYDVASPALVKEVRRRLTKIQGNFMREAGIIEQMIEDHPHSIYPQALVTERPDRVAALLGEGKVAIFLEGDPFAVVVPATLFSLVKTSEDVYLRPAFGTFMRLIRVVAIFIAYLLPGLYLAVVNHHQALLPTDLLLAIAGAREGVPFPSWAEVLLMETSFEVIREAGIRVPGVVGPTLGILGAVVLGQAAVAAAIVSPILIIVVAVTALAAFAIPNYALQFSTRIVRFGYIVLGYSLGLFGVLLGLAFQLVYTTGLTSFGVGYLSPVAPATKRDKDIVVRRPIFDQERRPDYLQPQRRSQQPNVSRKWTEAKPEQGGDSSEKK